MDGVEKANSGHPGTPMALAPVVYSLFTQVMKHDPADPHWLDRDRFVLSAGHASMLIYSILHLTGYDVSMDDLKAFRQLESKTPGHPEAGHTAGVETTTGPLGQGISTAVGMALAERMLNARFGDVIDHHTFVIASDGDMQEGIQAEAASIAGHLNLNRLIVFYDDNHISIEGDTAISFSEDVGKRYEAYGWEVVQLGEDIEVGKLTETFNAAKETDKPTLIIGRTHIGYGAPTLQDTGKAHGSPLGEDEIKGAKEFYGWPSQEPFFVPDGVYDHYKEAVAERAKAAAEWKDARPRPGRARAHARPGAARRLGRGHPAADARRQGDGDAQGVRGRDPVGRQDGPGAGRRLGRPGRLHQHDHRWRRQRRGRRVRRPQPALRHPRARHGRDRQRPHAVGLPRLRGDVPDVLATT